VRLKHLEFYESGNYEIFIQRYIDSLGEAKKVELVRVKQEHQEDYIRRERKDWEKKKDTTLKV
jgi:hypothetical protein